MDTTQLLKGVLDLAVLAVVDRRGRLRLRRRAAAPRRRASTASATPRSTARCAGSTRPGALTSYVVPSDEGPHRKYYGITADRPDPARQAAARRTGPPSPAPLSTAARRTDRRTRPSRSASRPTKGGPDERHAAQLQPGPVAAFLDKVRARLVRPDRGGARGARSAGSRPTSGRAASARGQRASSATRDAYADELRAGRRAGGPRRRPPCAAAPGRATARPTGCDRELTSTRRRGRLGALGGQGPAGRRGLGGRRRRCGPPGGCCAPGWRSRLLDLLMGPGREAHAAALARQPSSSSCRPAARAPSSAACCSGSVGSGRARARASLPSPPGCCCSGSTRSPSLALPVRGRRRSPMPGPPTSWPTAALRRRAEDHGPGLMADGRYVRNVFAYDAQGNPLTGVQLYDQNGSPAGGQPGRLLRRVPVRRRPGAHLPVVQRRPDGCSTSTRCRCASGSGCQPARDPWSTARPPVLPSAPLAVVPPVALPTRSSRRRVPGTPRAGAPARPGAALPPIRRSRPALDSLAGCPA